MFVWHKIRHDYGISEHLLLIISLKLNLVLFHNKNHLNSKLQWFSKWIMMIKISTSQRLTFYCMLRLNFI